MTKTEYNIVRRAYSQRTIVAHAVGFVAAELLAMRMQSERKDGEYFAVRATEGDRYHGEDNQRHLPIAWI